MLRGVEVPGPLGPTGDDVGERAGATRLHIKDAAAACGVSPDALRYYERLGLLPRAPRTSGGFRVYGPEVAARVAFIRQARALGLTLREIRDIVGADRGGGIARCRRVRDLLTRHLGELDERLAALRALRRTLAASLARCEEVLRTQGDECPVVDTLHARAVGRAGREPGEAGGPASKRMG